MSRKRGRTEERKGSRKMENNSQDELEGESDNQKDEDGKGEVGEEVNTLHRTGKKTAANRRDVYKGVATKRAAHFARSESSTTPTGSLRKKSKNNLEEEEVWPGPWTTAALIIQKRDEARKVREEKLKAGSEGKFTDDDPDVIADLYDQEITRVQWKPAVIRNKGERQNSFESVPSLTELCCKVIADHIQDYETEGGLEFLSNEYRERIAVFLAKRRKFDEGAALKLSCPNSNSIIFPDCSQLEENTFMKIVEKVCFPDSNINRADEADEIVHHSASSLQYLLLKNCGRGFSDCVAALLFNGSHALEEIRLDGCYRLSDDGIVKLLDGCSNALHTLALTNNPRLSFKSFEKISFLPYLRSLSFDYVTHVTDEHLQLLMRPEAPPLQEISIRGLTQISPQMLVLFIEKYGKSLKAIDFSACQVNDVVIMAIRGTCHTLSQLLLEQIDDVSSTALTGLFIPDRYSVNGSSIALSSSSSSSTIANGSKYVSGSIGPLETISFQGTSNITDEVVIQLCEHYGKNLKAMNFNGCNLLTERSLAAIWLHTSENLQYIDLSFVRNISEDSVGYLVECCRKLSELTVWGCTQLTDRFYYYIDNALQTSPKLTIKGRISI